MKKTKLLPIILAILLVAVVAFLFFGNDMEHIEDTNGADNFELQQITDENICKRDIGALNITESNDMIGDAVTYKSNKFTGVYEVFTTTTVTNRFEITVNHARVDEGNFKMVLCLDNENVHTFTLNELTQTFVLEDVKGTVSLRIAGESAKFQFDYIVY